MAVDICVDVVVAAAVVLVSCFLWVLLLLLCLRMKGELLGRLFFLKYNNRSSSM